MTLLDTLQWALRDGNVRAFLHVIREGESGQDVTAYRTLVGGSQFDDLSKHPRTLVRLSPALASTAAGAYQFLAQTWDECAAALGLQDFSPASQDLAAVYLIHRRGALGNVTDGQLDVAIQKCNREWASLPGSPYGQRTMDSQRAHQVYADWGGKYEPVEPLKLEAVPTQPPEPDRPASEAPKAAAPAPKKGWTMAPLIAAILPSIVQAIPALTRLFGHGGEINERNARAAETVVGIVQSATGAVNAQAAAEAVQADPELRAKAIQAVSDQWWQITEAGGGGIEGARKADAAAAEAGHKPWQSPSMWAVVVLAPLAYMVVGSVVGLWGVSDWSSDVRASIASAVISLTIGGIAGYYWGASTQRARPQQ